MAYVRGNPPRLEQAKARENATTVSMATFFTQLNQSEALFFFETFAEIISRVLSQRSVFCSCQIAHKALHRYKNSNVSNETLFKTKTSVRS